MSPGSLSYIEAAHIIISMGIVTWYACFHSDVFQAQAYRIGVFLFGLSLPWLAQGFVQYLWFISVLWVVVTMNNTYYNLQWSLWNNYVHLHLRNLPPNKPPARKIKKMKLYILVVKLNKHEVLMTKVALESDPERLNSISKIIIFTYN